MATLDPEAPLDDLEPLREIVGEARVVALGENAHFIREFAQLRHRVIRFLVERCGFTLHALEVGFCEGVGVNDWMGGAGGSGADADLEHLMGPFPQPVELRETLRWLRRHNQSRGGAIGFAGIDLPHAGGSLLPALRPLEPFIAEADPECQPWLAEAIALADRISATSMAAAAPLLQQRLTVEERHALAAMLTRLELRLHALRPQHIERFGRPRFDSALRHLQCAARTNYHLHAMLGFIAGNGLPGDMGARDDFMADSVLWHLNRAKSDERMVLVAHNAHIQKAPVVYEGVLSCLPMGQRLAAALGDDYVALPLTSAAGSTAGLYPDEQQPHGFRVDKEPLEPPHADSIEAVLADAGVELGMVGWRDAPAFAPKIDRIRYDTAYLQMPLRQAYDGILQVPTSTVADDLGL